MFKKTNAKKMDIKIEDGTFTVSLILSKSNYLFSYESMLKERNGIKGNEFSTTGENQIEFRITPEKGNFEKIDKEFRLLMSKASEFNIVLSADRDLITQKYNAFLIEYGFENRSNHQAALGYYQPGGNVS